MEPLVICIHIFELYNIPKPKQRQQKHEEEKEKETIIRGLKFTFTWSGAEMPVCEVL